MRHARRIRHTISGKRNPGGEFINDRWYYAGNPDTSIIITTTDGEFDTISIGDYATDDEKAKLKAMNALL